MPPPTPPGFQPYHAPLQGLRPAASAPACTPVSPPGFRLPHTQYSSTGVTAYGLHPCLYSCQPSGLPATTPVRPPVPPVGLRHPHPIPNGIFLKIFREKCGFFANFRRW